MEKELEWGRLEQGEKEGTINFSFSQTECVGMLMGGLFKYHAFVIHFSHTIIVLKLVQLMIVINQQESSNSFHCYYLQF